MQSGSIGIALLNSARGLGLSHLITSGNEAVTATADYLEALIDDPAVRTVIVFAEQIRKPQKFMAMARKAAEAGKPVIVLKSGRSERAKAAVMAHTGAVAGSVEACDAALAASGAIQVFTLDELLETAALVSQIRGRPAFSNTARKIGALSLSGGEIALALDAAEECGVAFAAARRSRGEDPAAACRSSRISPIRSTSPGRGSTTPRSPRAARKAMGELDGSRCAGAAAGRAHRSWRAAGRALCHAARRSGARSASRRQAAGRRHQPVGRAASRARPRSARSGRALSARHAGRHGGDRPLCAVGDQAIAHAKD